MNPTNKENAGIPLPAPPAEQLPSADTAETGLAPVEQAVAAVEAASAPPAAALSTPAPAVPAMALPNPLLSAQPPAAAPAAGSPATNLVADDGDLIEKEWVLKAKQIVERNRDDPYKQSEDLTLFKADYMKKRYGKTIKVSR